MSRSKGILRLAGAVLAGVAAVVLLRAENPGDRPCLPFTGRLAPGAGEIDLPASRAGVVLVANQFSSDAALVDLASGSVIVLPAGRGPHDAVVSPDGRWGVVSNFEPERRGRMEGNLLFVVDMAARRVVRTIETGEYRGLHDVAFRPGHPARVLVTAQTSRRVLEVDVETGTIVSAIDTRGDRSHLLAVSPDGRTVFTTNEGSSDISRLDLTTGQFVAAFPASPNVEGLALAAGGRELWTGEPAEGVVRVRDAETGAVLATLPGFRDPVRLVATDDGSRVIISDNGCGSLVVADAARRMLLHVYDVSGLRPFVGDVAPDGRVAFASSHRWFRGRLFLIDLETGAVVARHRAGRGADGLGWGPAVH